MTCCDVFMLALIHLGCEFRVSRRHRGALRMDEEDDWDWCASCDYVSSCFETCPTCQTKQCSGCAAACCYPEAIAQTLQPTRRKRKPTGNKLPKYLIDSQAIAWLLGPASGDQ